MELSGNKVGELTDGGGIVDNRPEKMETSMTQIETSWEEEVVTFKSKRLETFIRQNDPQPKGEYTMSDALCVLGNVIHNRHLSDKNNPNCYLFDEELRDVMGIRGSCSEEIRERLKERTVRTARMVKREPRCMFSGRVELRPTTIGEAFYGERKMAPQTKFRLSVGMLNILATVPKVGAYSMEGWKTKIANGILTWSDVRHGMSTYILNNRDTLLEKHNTKMCFCAQSELGELFGLKIFHRNQVEALIQQHMTPIGLGKVGVYGRTTMYEDTMEPRAERDTDQGIMETVKDTEQSEGSWLLVGLEQLAIREGTQKATRELEQDSEDETVESRRKVPRKNPVWKNYVPHPRRMNPDEKNPFLEDEVFTCDGDIHVLNELLVEHLRKVIDISWQLNEEVIFWADCPTVRLLNREDVYVRWTTRQHLSDVPEPISYLVMQNEKDGRQQFVLDCYVQMRTFELMHNGYALQERLAEYGIDIALRSWADWRDNCLVMILRRVEKDEVKRNLRKFLRITEAEWIQNLMHPNQD